MDYREVTGDREFFLTLAQGTDWHEEIATFAAERDVATAWFVGSGAVEDAAVGIYDQDDFEERTVSFAEPLEVPICVGSVTRTDGEPSVSASVTLARPSGQALAGRLLDATVFSGECYLRTFEETIDRRRDEATGRRVLSV
ncbi:MAG: PPC domain-containing DNA-binding protein [Halanaeroarchaeum sp.]